MKTNKKEKPRFFPRFYFLFLFCSVAEEFAYPSASIGKHLRVRQIRYSEMVGGRHIKAAAVCYNNVLFAQELEGKLLVAFKTEPLYLRTHLPFHGKA